MKYESIISIIFITGAGVVALFVLLTLLFFAIWVYKDCKLRGENPLLWLLILFFVSGFLGIIIYLVVRREKNKKCENCGYLISNSAKYCENCGLETQNSNNDVLVKEKSNRKYIIAGLTSFCMIIVTVIVMIISAISV